MKPGFEEILQFREGYIKMGLELDLKPGALLDRIHAGASKRLKLHEGEIIKGDEALLRLKHKRLRDDVGINLIRLGLADVVFPHGRGLDRVDHTDLTTFRNKVVDKVVTVVGRRLKTDDAVVRKGIQTGRQQVEAIRVICEFKRLKEYFAI